MSSRCDLTGISCEGRELLEIPGNAGFWVSPVVKMKLMEGKSIQQIKEELVAFRNRIAAMTRDEKEEHFRGSTIRVV